MLKINPWGLMWINPRAAIKNIVEYKPNYRFILFSALYGFVLSLTLAQTFSLGLTFNFWFIIFSCFVFCIPIGAISLSLSSLVIFWTGKLIKGQASYQEIKAALTWSKVTVVVSIFLLTFAALFLGPDFFNNSFAYQVYPLAFSYLLLSIFVAQFVLSIWSFVLFVLALSEVQKFSGWMALLNVILTSIFYGIIIFLLTMVLGQFAS